jgi:hypothetical protein
VGATEPSLDPPAAMGKAKWEPFVPGEAPLAGRRASMPEAVKPLAQQAQRYDHQTEQERKTDRALDALEGLGKLKK